LLAKELLIPSGCSEERFQLQGLSSHTYAGFKMAASWPNAIEVTGLMGKHLLVIAHNNVREVHCGRSWGSPASCVLVVSHGVTAGTYFSQVPSISEQLMAERQRCWHLQRCLTALHASTSDASAAGAEAADKAVQALASHRQVLLGCWPTFLQRFDLPFVRLI
jgi:hypothetical protein